MATDPPEDRDGATGATGATTVSVAPVAGACYGCLYIGTRSTAPATPPNNTVSHRERVAPRSPVLRRKTISKAERIQCLLATIPGVALASPMKGVSRG